MVEFKAQHVIDVLENIPFFNLPKINVVITGAYGLVGNAFCELFEKLPKFARDITTIHKIKFDDLSSLGDLKADYIIHAAGYGQPLKFTQDKIKTIEINTKTTEELFKYLKPGGKFLFVSTSEVYSGAPTPYKEISIGTTTPQHPRACYIEGKRCGEAIVMAHREAGVDAKIARLALAYGPGTKKGDTRVLNQFIEQALTKKRIDLLDAGKAMRTYVYVDDAVEMMRDVLLSGKEAVYNIGGESTISIFDLALKIADIVGGVSVWADASKGLEGAPEDVKVCLNRINAEFPRKFVSLEEGLKRTIEYQKKLYV